MNFILKSKNIKAVAFIVLLYIVWSILFIRKPSVIGIDGQRYFSLIDDAMVSMRYAWNFSHGYGLVWNPGERVEGYTNLLMTLMMSVYTLLFEKSDAVLAVQITGLGFVLGCSYIIWKLCNFLARDLEGRTQSFFSITVLIMTLTYYPLSYWSLTGMETGLLALLLLASLYFMEKYLREKRNIYLFIMAGLHGLAYLTRPDAIIFSVPIFLYIIYATKDDLFHERSKLTAIISSVILYTLFIFWQEIFRINYYNEYLPNTYYLKLTGMPLIERIKNGLGFIAPYLATHLLLLGISVFGFFKKPDSRKGLYLCLITLPIFYQVWVGGDPWPYWRIMAPVHPLLVILFVLSVYEILQSVGRPVFTKTGSRLLSYTILIGILISNLNFIAEMLFVRIPFNTEVYNRLINTALVLNEITTEDATLGVCWAGTLPYYTNRKGIDFLGKNDKYVSRLLPDLSGKVSWDGMYSVPGHNKYDLYYSVKQLRPTYTQYVKWGRQDISSWASANYLFVNYKGVGLWLLKGATEVKWEILSR